MKALIALVLLVSSFAAKADETVRSVTCGFDDYQMIDEALTKASVIKIEDVKGSATDLQALLQQEMGPSCVRFITVWAVNPELRRTTFQVGPYNLELVNDLLTHVDILYIKTTPVP